MKMEINGVEVSHLEEMRHAIPGVKFIFRAGCADIEKKFFFLIHLDEKNKISCQRVQKAVPQDER